MAGAGFKTFNTGDVLTSSDVNTYLMQQTVMVFDDATARSTALPTPSEGMFSYLKDTNLTYRYDGSAWLSDAGTTSPLTTKGDVWGYSTTDARIPVGANGTVLTADSGEALGVKWAAASGGYGAFTSFTPTWTNLTVGNGTVTGEYRQDEETVQVQVKLTFGSTTSITGNVQMTLPVTAASAHKEVITLSGRLLDSGSSDTMCWVQIVNTTTCSIQWPRVDTSTWLNGVLVNATSPWTWATNDQINFFFTYEKA